MLKRYATKVEHQVFLRVSLMPDIHMKLRLLPYFEKLCDSAGHGAKNLQDTRNEQLHIAGTIFTKKQKSEDLRCS